MFVNIQQVVQLLSTSKNHFEFVLSVFELRWILFDKPVLKCFSLYTIKNGFLINFFENKRSPKIIFIF